MLITFPAYCLSVAEVWLTVKHINQNLIYKNRDSNTALAMKMAKALIFLS